MKELLRDVLTQTLKSMEEKYEVDLSAIKIEVKENKEKDFGDFSTNLALILSKKLSEHPKKIAENLLEEFEELPFVRSLFFRYQLSFPSDNMKSVMKTDSTGKISSNFASIFIVE